MSNFKVHSVLVLVIISNLVVVGYGQINTDEELVGVIVTYRHGDRSPVFGYPNDIYNISKEFPEGLGQLTNEGKQRQFWLGKWLRERYADFLSDTYTPDEFYVCSTDMDRTFMSAASNLAGLYPPHGDQVWNENIPWQPIPIHTCPLAVLSVLTTCPQLDKLNKEVLGNEEFTEINKANADLFAYLTEKSGMSVTNFALAAYLRDTLFVELHNKLQLPDWALSVYPKELEPMGALMYQAMYGYNDNVTRLTAGPFLQNVIDHFSQLATNSTGQQKFLMYSGHDANIAAILSGMHAFEPHCPYYAATLIFELYYQKTPNTYVVRILHKDKEDALPVTLEGCSTVCPLTSFKKNLANVAIKSTDWTKKCFVSPNVKEQKSYELEFERLIL